MINIDKRCLKKTRTTILNDKKKNDDGMFRKCAVVIFKFDIEYYKRNYLTI